MEKLPVKPAEKSGETGAPTVWLAWGVGLFMGYLIWVFSEPVTGRREPWDAGGPGAAYYPGALFVAGLIGQIVSRRPRQSLFGIYWGQVIFMFTGPEGPGGLFPLGMIFLVFCMIPAIAGAGAGMIFVKSVPPPERPPALKSGKDYLKE